MFLFINHAIFLYDIQSDYLVVCVCFLLAREVDPYGEY